MKYNCESHKDSLSLYYNTLKDELSNMITFLLILYIGLAIMNGIVIARNNTDAETVNEVDRSKGFLKPYTLTIFSSVITILLFMESNVVMGCLFALNVLLDLRQKA